MTSNLFALQNLKKITRVSLSVIVGMLFIFLPIYTPLTTFLINKASFPYWIVYWKEVLAIGFVILASLEIAIIQVNTQFKNIRTTWPARVFLLLLFWMLLISFLNSTAKESVIYGIRFELWWVMIFAVGMSWLQTVRLDEDWAESKKLFQTITSMSIYCGAILSTVFASSIYFLGQTSILSKIGYGQYSGDSVYLNPVLCHAVDAFSQTCRLSGGFTLPNHYAGYLLLVLGYFLTQVARKQVANNVRILAGVLSFVSTILIIGTSSRFALLGLVIIYGWLIIAEGFRIAQKFIPSYSLILTKISIVSLLIIPAMVGVIGINLSADQLRGLPLFIGKPYSTYEHYRRTMANIEIIQDNPTKSLTGYGAGSSGPAAKPEYIDINSNPLYQKYSNLETKWDIGNGLFVPENWYIQLILNGGIFYAIVYVFLVAFPLWKLLYRLLKAKTNAEFGTLILKPAYVLYVGMYAILVGNLFLHIWENQTVALYYALLPSVVEID